MMGGGGGGYFPSRPEDLQKLIQQARDRAEQQKLDAEIGQFLQTLLAKLNERDIERVQECLDELKNVLEQEAEIEAFRFGGSVAKHTYVDGLSDIDALVILEGTEESAQDLLDRFHEHLRVRLFYDKVAEVSKGKLAVTIKYRDGLEIQLLPALRYGKKVRIARADGGGWRIIDPAVFHAALTRANQRMNNLLVPAIKLFKSAVSDLPSQKQLKSYHIETLSVDAAKAYKGPKNVKSILLHLLEHSAARVLQPIGDLTGQSQQVDEYLGNTGSTKRRIVSDGLAGLARRLGAASSADNWKEIFGQ